MSHVGIRKKKLITIAVSGGFDPIHIGHIRLFQHAKKLGDKLVVILNNDNWLMKKKGHVFMPEKERKEIIEAISGVDGVLVTKHTKNIKDMSICRELKIIRPDIFGNGGDRTSRNIPEYELCRKLGIKMKFGLGHGGKVQSSSWLIGRIKNGEK